MAFFRTDEVIGAALEFAKDGTTEEDVCDRRFSPCRMFRRTNGPRCDSFRVQDASNRHRPHSLGGEVKHAANTVGLGQFALGSFVADSTTQSIVFTGSAGVQLSGFQVRDLGAIPEPSSYAVFAGFTGLGLAALRRRRQN